MPKRQKQPHWIKRNAEMIKAVVIFATALVVFFWILNNDWILANIFDPFTGLVAEVTVWIFLIAGQSASAIGKTVTINDTTLSIATGCNGVEAIALYLAAILAFPVQWRKKVVGVGIGFVGIFIVNQIRVAGLFLVAMFRPDMLPQAHHYAGQTFVIVMGMALLFFWAEKYAGLRYPQNRPPAR